MIQPPYPDTCVFTFASEYKTAEAVFEAIRNELMSFKIKTNGEDRQQYKVYSDEKHHFKCLAGVAVFELRYIEYGLIVLSYYCHLDRDNFGSQNTGYLITRTLQLIERLVREHGYTCIPTCSEGKPFSYTYVKNHKGMI